MTFLRITDSKTSTYVYIGVGCIDYIDEVDSKAIVYIHGRSYTATETMAQVVARLVTGGATIIE